MGFFFSVPQKTAAIHQIKKEIEPDQKLKGAHTHKIFSIVYNFDSSDMDLAIEGAFLSLFFSKKKLKRFEMTLGIRKQFIKPIEVRFYHWVMQTKGRNYHATGPQLEMGKILFFTAALS